MAPFFIGFFSSMAFTGFVIVVCAFKDAFKSGFVLGD